MLKLVSGHRHQHSPTGIATKTPSREMEAPLRSFEDMEASPKADAQQGSGSHTYSEGTPPNDWGDSTYTLSPAEKRRKMNRESARRTRQRKQEQTVSLRAEVASLQTQNVCINEQLKSLSDKNQELTAERQKLYEQNNMLIKCVAELSAVCKRKEATLGELRHCIQTADKLTDIPLPPVEQVQGQLSSQSLEMLRIPQLSIPTMAQPSSCKPDATRLQPGGHHGISKIDCDPLVNMPAETTSHLLTPTQMHDAGSGYLPSQKQPLMTPLHSNSTFSRTPMMSSSTRTTGIVGLPRSTSLGTMSWVPTVGSNRHSNLNSANAFASNSLPTSSFNLHNAPIASGNSTQKASNPMQQTRGMQPRCASSQTCVRMPRFDFEGNPQCPQGQSPGARQALMIEAAKQQDGFNPKHVSDIVRMTQQTLPSVQRASSDPSFFRLTPTSRHSEGMQEILGRSFDWKAEGSQDQSLDSSLAGSLGGAITHDPQASAQEQIIEMSTRGFCHMPMQHLDESAGGNHNYAMQ